MCKTLEIIFTKLSEQLWKSNRMCYLVPTEVVRCLLLRVPAHGSSGTMVGRVLDWLDLPYGDILLVVGNFADECAVAPLLVSRQWRWAAFVGAGVEEVLASLGELREGLLGPAQWVAHTSTKPDEGPDAQWFVTHYREEEKGNPPYAATQAFAAGILYARCLRETGDTHDESIQAAAQKLVCQTLFGKFQLDPLSGLQTGHQVAIVQWHQGQRYVVWPPEQAERPPVFSHST